VSSSDGITTYPDDFEFAECPPPVKTTIPQYWIPEEGEVGYEGEGRGEEDEQTWRQWSTPR